jgi:predicted HTH transcriptional regulator
MKTRELEAMLQGGIETPTLDFKAACDWKADSMAKDILAMANVQDGGYIIIGVEEGTTFIRQGITLKQKESFKLDIMRDQMARFADPRVVFTVEFPRDKDDREYAVIRVLPFDEVPVICAVGNGELRPGIIYYRNSDKRPESAPVSNAYDMRDIISTAAERMMRRLVAKGFTVHSAPSTAEQTHQAFKAERGEL